MATSRALGEVAEDEFAIPARKIGRRAMQIGTAPDYDRRWGD